MRILFLINNLGSGGKERQLVELIKGCVAKGNDCRLLLSKNIIHYQEIHTTLPEIFILNKNRIIALFQVFVIINKFRPDIVHSFISCSSFYLSLCKPFLDFRFVEESVRSAPSRDVFSTGKKILDQFNFFFSDAIVSNSRAGLSSYRVPAKKAHVIYNGFDFSRIASLRDEQEVRDELYITTPYIVGMVANFTQKKDYRAFFSVAEATLRHRKDVTFVAVGAGLELPELKSRFSGNPWIRFTGTRKKVEDIVNVFTICLLLSNLTYFEGISNSIMEYMALAKPVIATSGGGTPELIEDKKSGFLVKENNTEEIVRHINYLLDFREDGRKMGSNGQARIQTYFHFEKMVDEHLALFYGLLK